MLVTMKCLLDPHAACEIVHGDKAIMMAAGRFVGDQNVCLLARQLPDGLMEDGAPVL